ncbi:hypothetical protein ACQKNC_11080 [Lysinibacillus sp. NPDC094177]|uniref:hypothetical protein n=1 Tax=Lysinibacillus sp. NPDC094177 TaxID=3390580 RepID=UPI003CFCEFD3
MFSGFEWLPKKWGKRKVSEQFHQAKIAEEGKEITISTYAIDLFLISIPLKVNNIILFDVGKVSTNCVDTFFYTTSINVLLLI